MIEIGTSAIRKKAVPIFRWTLLLSTDWSFRNPDFLGETSCMLLFYSMRYPASLIFIVRSVFFKIGLTQHIPKTEISGIP